MNLHLHSLALLLGLLGGAQLSAQNRLQHHDGSNEGSTPGITTGAPPGSGQGIIQRFPEEQWCGRDCISCITVEFEDLAPGVAKPFLVEVREGFPGLAGTPLDSPNMAPAGLVAPPIPAFKVGGARIASVQVLLPCVPLRPGFDTYVCIYLQNPALRVRYSSNEDHRAAVTAPCILPGRYGVFPDIGLAWAVDPTAPGVAVSASPVLSGPISWSWAIGASVLRDVCQAFGSGFPLPGPTDYGYVGIYPDSGRGDAVGVRLRSSQPAGTPCVLFIGLTKMLPLNISIFDPRCFSGILCVQPEIIIPGTTTAGEGPCISGSRAVFGPFPTPLLCAVDICAQCASLDAGTCTLRLSTACKIDF